MLIRTVAIILGVICVAACWPLAAALLGVGVLLSAGAGRGMEQP